MRKRRRAGVGRAWPINRVFETLEAKNLLVATPFDPPVTTAGLSDPMAVRSADLDRDGNLDLVVSNYSATGNSISIFLGNGNGTFAPSPIVEATGGVGNGNVEVEDLNGDNRLDLIVAHTTSNGVTILLSQDVPVGSIGFSEPMFRPTGSSAVAVAIGEFDGDGIRDIAVTNFNSASVSILAGSANWNEVQEIGGLSPSGSGVHQIRVADLNADSKDDLIVSDVVESKVYIFRGEGANSFTALPSNPTGNWPGRIQVADVNHDATLDIVTSNYFGGSVSLLSGNGDGTFDAATSVLAGGSLANPVDVRVSDLNLDGNLDLVVSEYGADQLRLLLGQGDGTFTVSDTIISTGDSPRGAAIGDYNKDGRPDIAVISELAGTLAVSLNQSTNVPLLVQSPSIAVDTALWIAAGDLNDDMIPDLVTCNNEGAHANTIAVMLGKGNGSYGAPVYFATGAAPRYVVVQDFSLDGKADVLVANSDDDTVGLFIGNGLGGLAPMVPIAVGDSPNSLALVALNGDNFPDIVVANGAGESLSVVLSNNARGFHPQVSYSLSGAPKGLVVGEFTGDARPDVAVANSETDQLQIYENQVGGILAPWADLNVGDEPTYPTTGDFDRDGRADLAVSNHAEGTISVWRRNEVGQFAVRTDYPAGVNPVATTVSDFNLDGNLDLAVTNQNSGPLYLGPNDVGIYLGSASGNLETPKYLQLGEGSYGLVATDLTRDGVADLAVANIQSGTLDVLVNQLVPANYAPKLTPGGDVIVLEDSGSHSIPWATNISAGHPSENSTQTISFELGGTNSPLFTQFPTLSTDGTLHFTVAPNQFGRSVIGFIVHDSAGGVSSAHRFSVFVSGVNDPPSFTPGGNVTVLEDSGAYQAAWATAISAGPSNESASGLAFQTSNDSPNLFSVQPTIDVNGVLRFTPAANAAGTATVTVTLRDSQGGNNTSAPVTFEVTLINDVVSPSFTRILPNLSVNNPIWVATGDLNGDMLPDLVTGNYGGANDDTVSVMLGFGDGTYSAPTNFAAGGAPQFVVVQDVNLDSNDDVVVVNSDDDNVGIFYGDGTGSLASMVTYPVGNFPAALALTSLNSDNFPDIVVANLGGDSLSVLLSDDAGSYHPQIVYPLNGTPIGLTVGEYTGDTRPDIAVANFDTNELQIYSNQVGGTLAPSVTLAVGQHPEYPTTGDFDGDGRLDLAVSNHAEGTISVWRRNAAGQFAIRTDYPAGVNPVVAAAADFNLDGHLDLAVTNQNSSPLYAGPNDVGIYLGSASGSFEPVEYLTAGEGSYGLVAADLTRDGVADLAVANNQSGTLDVLVNPSIPANYAPKLTPGGDVMVLEDSGSHSIPWATNISAGHPSEESTQTISFEIGGTNSPLFTQFPTLSTDGTLHFTVAPNQYGRSIIGFIVHDSAGGVSSPHRFSIFVSGVNDPPIFSPGGNITVPEDSGAYAATWATGIAPGPGNETTTSGLSFQVTNDSPQLFSEQPTIDANGVLRFTPALNAAGTAAVSVSLRDSEGGNDTSAPVTFSLTIEEQFVQPSVWYPLDGNVVDVSGNHLNGTLPGGSSDPVSAPDRNGLVNRAFDFDGVDDYVTLNSNVPDPALSTGFTVAAWARAETLSDFRSIIMQRKFEGQSYVPQFMLALDGSPGAGVAYFYLASSAATPGEPGNTADGRVAIGSSAGSIAAHEWYHVAGVYDRTTQVMQLYVNGVLAASQAHTTMPTTASPYDVTVGRSAYGYFFDGSIDDVRMFDHALTATQIQDMFSEPPTNVAPVAVDDTASVQEDGAVIVNVLANDSDADGLLVPANLVAFSQPNHGEVVKNGDGTFTYTPSLNFYGADSFTYTLDDGEGGVDTATVSLTVNPVNDAPVAGDDAWTGYENGTVVNNVSTNDSDVDSNSLTFAVASGPTQGALTFQTDGTFSYLPEIGFTGVDSFTYTVNDGAGGTATSHVTLTISPLVPSAWYKLDGNVDDAMGNHPGSLPGGTSNPLVAQGHDDVNFHGYDFDGADDYITLGSNLPDPALLDGFTVMGWIRADDLEYGGQNLIRPLISQHKYEGRPFVPQFLLALDGRNVTNRATFFLASTVATPGENDPADGRVAVNSSIEVQTNQWYHLAGTYDRVSQRMILYVNGEFAGETLHTTMPVGLHSSSPVTLGRTDYGDHLDGSIDDVRIFDHALTARQVHEIYGEPSLNVAPHANDDQFTVDENTPTLIDVLANDIDPDSALIDPTSVTIVTPPAHGTLVVHGDGRLTYSPNANYLGEDSFTYTINDGQLTSNIASVAITVVIDPPEYGTPVTVPGLNGPRDIEALSLNGDQYLDLVVTNQLGSSLTVLHGNSSGSYTVAGTYGLNSGSLRLVSALLNNDPYMDIAVVEPSANVVEVLLGNSDGTFQPRLTYSVGAFPIDISVGDFNADGVPDLVTANFDGGTATVLTGDGLGGFSVTRNQFVSTRIASVKAVDFDGDGRKDDLVTCDGLDDFVSVMFGDGSGGFSNPVNYHADDYAWKVDVKDFNRDGILDIVSVNREGFTVSYFQGTSPGVFRPAVNFPAGQAPNDITAADVNGDGYLDVVVPSSGDDTIRILLGSGDGNFSLFPDALATGDLPLGIGAFDLDSNGTLDLASTNFSGNSVTVWMNQGTHGPRAVDDAYVVAEDASLAVRGRGVLDNDTSLGSPVFQAVLSQGPAHGVVNLAADGSFVYTPSANYFGTDTFRYTISDGVYTSNEAVVTVTVNAVDDPLDVAILNVTPNTLNALGDIVAVTGRVRDVDSVGTVTAVLDWGDGTTQETVVLDSDGMFTASHAYASNARYWITLHGSSGAEEATARYRLIDNHTTPYATANEFRVNQFTSTTQRIGRSANVAPGQFAYVWESNNQDGSDYTAMLAIYDSQGNVKVGEYRLSDRSLDAQTRASIATDGHGNLFVVWQEWAGDADGWGIRGRRFHWDGTTLRSDSSIFIVNSNSQGAWQSEASVAMNEHGDAVVLWSGPGGGYGDGTWMRRFPTGVINAPPEQLINTHAPGTVFRTRAAIDATGNIATSWGEWNGTNYKSHLRLFNGQGQAIGSEVTLSANGSTNDLYPDVAINAGYHEVAVVWATQGPLTNEYDVVFQRFSTDTGASIDHPIPIGDSLHGDQRQPSIAKLPNGYVVAWSSTERGGAGYDAIAQYVDFAGAGVGSEFTVNQYTTSNQFVDSVASGDRTEFVVAWTSEGQDGSQEGVYSRHFEVNPRPRFELGSDVTLLEGGLFSRTVSIIDLDTIAASLTATVDYGDDTGTQSIPVQSDKSFVLNHLYSDNHTTAGTPYTISLTISDGLTPVADSVAVLVNNVPPTISNVSVAPAPIYAGGTATLSATISDPGLLDTQTVNVSWGDGTTTQPTVGSVPATLSLDHTYANGLDRNAPSSSLAIWKFDELGGTTVADSAHASHGSTSGGPTFVPGVFGNALSFDGNDGVVLANNNLNVGANDFAISTWVKPEMPDGSLGVIFMFYNGTPTYGLGINSGGMPELGVRDVNGNKVVFAGSQSIVDGNWHHVVASRVGSTLAITVDGVVAATQNAPNVGNISGSGLQYVRIGGAYTSGGFQSDSSSFDGDDYYKGLIDETTIYNPSTTPQPWRSGVPIGVRVTDDDGATTSLSVGLPIAVHETPTFDLGVDAVLGEGSLFSRTVSISDTDTVASLLTATVDYGDGTGPQSIPVQPDKSVILNHQYVDNLIPDGSPYTVTLSVSDGFNTPSDSMSVRINNAAPTISNVSVTPAVVYAGGTATLTATIDDPGSLDTQTVNVSWGDGTLSQPIVGSVPAALSVDHTYVSGLNRNAPSDSLALWKFDELSGSVVNDSARSSHGVNYGAEIVPGIFGNALQFDGNDGVVLANQDLNIGSGDFSISAWVRPDLPDQDVGVIFTLYNGFPTYGVAVLPDGRPAFSARDSAGAVILVAGNQPITDGNWHHLIATRTGETVELRIDGFSVASGTKAGLGDLSGIGAQYLRIGGGYTGSGFSTNPTAFDGNAFYKGLIDEISIQYPNVAHPWRSGVPIGIRAIDDDGGATSLSVGLPIAVHETPTFDLGVDAVLGEGSLFSRTVTVIDTDTVASSLTATVDYGDGTGPQSIPVQPDKSVVLNHRYSDNLTPNGSPYTITLTVSDGFNAPSDSMSVRINNAAPTISNVSVTPAAVYAGVTATLTATIDDPGSLDTQTVNVSWGDGTVSQPIVGSMPAALSVDHTYVSGIDRNAPSDSLALWKFDESSGSVVNDSARSSHGVNYGAEIVPGIFGNALQFDGNDGVVLANQDLNVGSSDFSISAWVRPDLPLQDASVIFTLYNGVPTYGMAILADGRPAFSARDSAGAVILVAGSQPITDGNWHHLIATRTGSTVELKIDGFTVAAGTQPGLGDLSGVGAQYLRIGAGYTGPGFATNPTAFDGTVFYKGLIDEISVHYPNVAHPWRSGLPIGIQVADDDGGLTSLSVGLPINGSLTTLTDANTATNAVPESAAIGTLVGITALAIDSDVYDSVTYSLDDNAGGRFAIGLTTGVVTVAGSLDFESAAFHDVVVRATSTDGSFVTQSWRIDVQDVQEAYLIAGTDRTKPIHIRPTGVAGEYEYWFSTSFNPSPSSTVKFTPLSDVLISGTDRLILDGNLSVNSFDIHESSIRFNGTNFLSVGVPTREINALGSGDTIQVFAGTAIVNGGTDSDSLTAMSSANHVWTLTGPNSGNLDGQIQFTSVERLFGGAQDDLFQFGAAGSVSGQVDGGGGRDTLDYAQVATPISVNWQTGTATRSGVIASIEQLIGGAASDTLIGVNAANSWAMTDVNTGTLNATLDFASFENLTGGTANDTFEFQQAASLTGNLNGGSSADTLVFLTSDDLNANLEARKISRINGTFTSIENVDFGSGNNQVLGTNTVTSWRLLAANQVLVDGIDFAPVQQLVGGTAVDTIIGPNVASVWNLTGANEGAALNFTWNGMEQVTGGTQVDTFLIQPGASLSGTLNGGGGNDVASYENYDTGVVVDLSVNSMTAIATIASVSSFVGTPFSDTMVGANNNNAWTVTTNGGSVDGLSFVSFENWQGGTATDTLRGTNAATVWDVDGLNAGTLNGFRFTSMETLVGGSDVDRFRMFPGSQVSGIVQGGGGIDVLDWSAYGSSVNVNLDNSSTSNVASFASVMELIGSSQSDTLTGANNANTWLLSTAQGGSVDGVAFSQFESLVGGSAVDTFRPSPVVAFTGTVLGGAGLDKLDYAAFAAPVIVDLGRGLASLLSSVSGVECVTGGAGDDLLIGDGQDNAFLGRNGNDILIGGGGNDTLSGDNGRDIVIGGTGLDLLRGNAADDILVGGWTIYAAEDGSSATEVALNSLRSEWVRTDLNLQTAYATRVGHLLGTIADGLNGSHVLNSTTLFDDAVADRLFGDTNQDWFLSGLLDDVMDQATNEINTDV